MRPRPPEVRAGPTGDPTERRLEPEDPAERRRDADRAGAIRAVGEGAEAGSDRSPCSPGGAAGRARKVPRVPAGWPQQVVGHVLVADVGRVGLSQEHGSRSPEPLGEHTVVGRDVVLEELGAQCGADAGGGFEVLKRVRDPVEGPQEPSLHRPVFRCPSQLASVIRGHRQEGVEPRVETLDAAQHRLGQLHRRELPGTDQATQLGRRRVARSSASIASPRQGGRVTRRPGLRTHARRDR